MYKQDRREEFKGVPWQQGRVLDTINTRHWSAAQRSEVDEIERRTAFAHFSASDEGRGREYVHQFQNAKECAAAIEEHNDALKAANV